MTAYNVVRFKVKAAREKDFVDLHKKLSMAAKGFRKGALVKTGDRTYCFVGEWGAMSDIAGGRAAMIANLDQMRDMLEDLGHGMGVTDPVSGDAVVEIMPA